MAFLLDSVLRLIAPPLCAACDAPLPDDALLCARCDTAGAFHAAELGDGSRLVATGMYAGPLSVSIRRFKYGERPDLARPIGARVAKALTAAGVVGPASLVPVPLHPRKLAERGYNQSALVAVHAGRALGWPVRPLALARARDTDAQASLDRRQRPVNVADAFVARAPIAGEPVVLVDDVVTTGATALACNAALSRAGARVVAVAAVARAP